MLCDQLSNLQTSSLDTISPNFHRHSSNPRDLARESSEEKWRIPRYLEDPQPEFSGSPPHHCFNEPEDGIADHHVPLIEFYETLRQ